MGTDDDAASRRAAQERARRRRRLEEVFGRASSQTRDDQRDPGDPTERPSRNDAGGGEGANEDRLRREVPPHHGTP
ncbi:MAG: hypothetical protein ACTHNS_01005 [Marmoricola sp.]